jgi:hypothetical protein
MSAAIPQNANLFRGAHHPVAFQKQVFRYAKFMMLYSGDENPGVIEASFIWERYAPTLSRVHSYGCRISNRRNQKKPKTRDVYCGAFHINACHIRGLATTDGLPEVTTADVVHHVEANEIAHASLRVVLRDGIGEDDIEGVKTVIVDRIWNNSRGPLAHKCEGDKDLNPHPSANLSAAPLGPYVDQRSKARRLWCLARFWWLCFVWKVQMSFAPTTRVVV